MESQFWCFQICSRMLEVTRWHSYDCSPWVQSLCCVDSSGAYSGSVDRFSVILSAGQHRLLPLFYKDNVGEKVLQCKKRQEGTFWELFTLACCQGLQEKLKLQFYDSFNLYAHQQLALALPGLEVFFSGSAKVVVHPVIHLGMACRYVHQTKVKNGTNIPNLYLRYHPIWLPSVGVPHTVSG